MHLFCEIKIFSAPKRAKMSSFGHFWSFWQFLVILAVFGLFWHFRLILAAAGGRAGGAGVTRVEKHALGPRKSFKHIKASTFKTNGLI